MSILFQTAILSVICSLVISEESYLVNPYLLTETGSPTAPTHELRRINRSAWKWWDELFNQNVGCNNNYATVPSLPTTNCNIWEQVDPFKQLKILKKFPDLFRNTCNSNCNQHQVNNENYEGGNYGPISTPITFTPNEAYVPQVPSGVTAPTYDGPGDGNTVYGAPSTSTIYNPKPDDGYGRRVENYGIPSAGYYGPSENTASQPGIELVRSSKAYSPIVYQPIIYLTTALPVNQKEPLKTIENVSYPANYDQSSDPSVDSKNQPSFGEYSPTPSSDSIVPIRLTLADQPYRVAPELFSEYNYLLSLGNRKY